MLSPLQVLFVSVVVGQVNAGSLLEKHEEHLRKIHSFQCAIDQVVSVNGGKNWTTMKTITGVRSGDRERVHTTEYWDMEPSGKLEKLGRDRHFDFALKPDGVKTMGNLDPKHPPQGPGDKHVQIDDEAEDPGDDPAGEGSPGSTATRARSPPTITSSSSWTAPIRSATSSRPTGTPGRWAASGRRGSSSGTSRSRARTATSPSS